MLPIIVILFVAFIVSPLIDLITNERAQYFAKVVVYILAFFYVAWLVFFVHLR